MTTISYKLLVFKIKKMQQMKYRRRAFVNYSIDTARKAAILRIESLEFCRVSFEATLASQSTRRKEKGSSRRQLKSSETIQLESRLSLASHKKHSPQLENKLRDRTPSCTKMEIYKKAGKLKSMSIQHRASIYNLKQSSTKI